MIFDDSGAELEGAVRLAVMACLGLLVLVTGCSKDKTEALQSRLASAEKELASLRAELKVAKDKLKGMYIDPDRYLATIDFSNQEELKEAVFWIAHSARLRYRRSNPETRRMRFDLLIPQDKSDRLLLTVKTSQRWLSDPLWPEFANSRPGFDNWWDSIETNR